MSSRDEPGTTYFWSPYMVAELRRLWAVEEYSLPAVARLMGLTMSAVRGKVQRLGLPPRAPTDAPLPVAYVSRPPLAVGATLDVPRRQPSGPVPRAKSCQWPLWGDERVFQGDSPRFCAAPLARPASSYCPDHHARAFTPARRSSARAP